MLGACSFGDISESVPSLSMGKLGTCPGPNTLGAYFSLMDIFRTFLDQYNWGFFHNLESYKNRSIHW